MYLLSSRKQKEGSRPFFSSSASSQGTKLDDSGLEFQQWL